MYTLNNFYDFTLEAGKDFGGSTILAMLAGNHSPLASDRSPFPLAFGRTAASNLEVASTRPFAFNLEAFAVRAVGCSYASTNHSFKCLWTSYSHQFAAKV